MIYTKDLAYAYPGGRQLAFPDITCQSGEVLLITGQSGSGKTTLLHLLAGLLRPTRGSIQVAGSAIETLTAAAMDAFRGRHIGIIYQQSHFIASLSLRENLELPVALGHRSGDAGRMQAVAEKLGIAALLHKKPARLSQGEQQRASIARALMQELLLGIWEREQKTVLFVTHDIEEAIFLGSRVVVMTARPGRLRGELAEKQALRRGELVHDELRLRAIVEVALREQHRDFRGDALLVEPVIAVLGAQRRRRRIVGARRGGRRIAAGQGRAIERADGVHPVRADGHRAGVARRAGARGVRGEENNILQRAGRGQHLLALIRGVVELQFPAGRIRGELRL